MPTSRWSSMSTPPWSPRTHLASGSIRCARSSTTATATAGTGEPLAIALRPGNAGSNTATDHIAVISAALRQLPAGRAGKSVLVRIDGAGSTHKVIDRLTGRRLAYSVGFTLPENTPDPLQRIPEHVWTPAYDAHCQVRDGAWVELTDLLDLTGRPKGMRVIVRKERPHPGAQLRFEDVDGMRITAFATNTVRGQLPDLELRHRRRARLRRPHPGRQGHRPCQPAAVPLQRQPHLVRRRRVGRRDHRLDADARVRRGRGPPMGAEEAALPDLHLRRDPGPQRAAGLAAPLRPITLGRHDPDRAPTPGRPRPRLRAANPSPRPRKTPGPGTGAHPGRHRGPCHTRTKESRPAGSSTARRRAPPLIVKDRG